MSGRGRQLHGVVDYRNHTLNDLAYEAFGGTCTVDGVEIASCFYVDTEQGIVKTYDLRGVPGLPQDLQDGKSHFSNDLSDDAYPGLEVHGSALSRTLRGKVELFAPAAKAHVGSNR